MARPLRSDWPGKWVHVMGRGIARRSVFEDPRDYRFFLACVARVVRAKMFEVHAYSLPVTHFHLLVRSKGGLSPGMRNVLSRYTRRFNWRRPGRDGALFRGRFRSKWVDSLQYRNTVVRYIDYNAVDAALADQPVEYPWSSAWYLAASRRVPAWLSTSWTDPRRCRRSGRGSDYRSAFGAPLSEEQLELATQRAAHRGDAADDLDEVLGSGARGVRSWLDRRIALADQTAPGGAYPLVAVRSVRAVAELHRRRAPDAALTLGSQRSRPLWDVAEAFLLRELAGAGLDEIAKLIDRDGAWVRRLLRIHSAAISDDRAYRAIIEQLIRQALDRCHGAAATSDVPSTA